MEDEKWIVDDAAIPDEAYVHRRLTSQSHVVIDSRSGRYAIGTSAYSYREDGMSVYVSSAMDSEGLSDTDLLGHCSNGLARVQVLTIRREDLGASYAKDHVPFGTVADGEERETRGGVILRQAIDGPEDERIRKSHGLVRIPEPPVARKLWNAFRNKLIQGSEIKHSDEAGWVSASGVD